VGGGAPGGAVDVEAAKRVQEEENEAREDQGHGPPPSKDWHGVWCVGVQVRGVRRGCNQSERDTISRCR
jgi:hypothetical protein